MTLHGENVQAKVFMYPEVRSLDSLHKDSYVAHPYYAYWFGKRPVARRRVSFFKKQKK